jgi:ABC-type glycerol-3-phosphate transport system substrate-binding protein
MKKAFAAGLVLVLALAAAGCGSAPAAPQAVSDPNMPPWINEQVPEDMLWGIGSSSNASMSLKFTMADADARADIARQLQTSVQGMVTNFQREAGGIDNTAALGFQQSINRQLAQATLTGAVRDRSWTTSDGKTLWVRLKLAKADAARFAAGEVDKLVESEASRYAEFKAMDALKMMDEELSKYSSKPEPVIK